MPVLWSLIAQNASAESHRCPTRIRWTSTNSWLHLKRVYMYGKQLFWILNLMIKWKLWEQVLVTLWTLHTWRNGRGCGVSRTPYISVSMIIRRSRKVSEARGQCLEFSNCFAIWRASRQYCCRGACQTSKQFDYFNMRSRSFDSSRDPTIRHHGVLSRSPGFNHHCHNA